MREDTGKSGRPLHQAHALLSFHLDNLPREGALIECEWHNSIQLDLVGRLQPSDCLQGA